MAVMMMTIMTCAKHENPAYHRWAAAMLSFVKKDAFPVKEANARPLKIKPPASPSRRSSRPGTRDVQLGVLLFGILLYVYLPALQGGFLWDDDAHITLPELQSLSGLGRIW